MTTYDTASPTALLFNITKGSFVDGYGIRTTIFLKGCPLKCKWCCNPEGQSFAPELRLLIDRCRGCGKCVPLCPEKALTISDGLVQVDRARCTGCGKCTSACWFDALQIYGRETSAREMFDEIIRDKPFFADSGGGLTIGGGEATCWPDFCLEMIRLCHEAGINVAIDTCGYVIGEKRFSVLEQADLILFDIKGLNDAAHIANTGVSNRVIHENLRRLDALGKSVIIRYPMIPGYNLDEAEAIADYLTVYDETVDDSKNLEIFDPDATWKRKEVYHFEARELLVPIYQKGKLVYKRPSVEEIKKYCAEQVDTLWDEVKRFDNPHNYYVDLSQKLYDIKTRLLNEKNERREQN